MQNYIDDIRISEDNFLQVSINNVRIDINQFSVINSDTNNFINCTRDRYDQNCLLYYVENCISLEEFILNQSFDFMGLKTLFLSLSNLLINCNDKKLTMSNAIISPEYIFVDKNTGVIKLVYLPVSAGANISEMNRSFQDLLKEMVNNVHAFNSTELLGFVFAQSTVSKFDIFAFQKDLSGIKLEAKGLKFSKELVGSIVTIISLLIFSIVIEYIGMQAKLPILKNKVTSDILLVQGVLFAIGSLISILICFLVGRKTAKNKKVAEIDSVTRPKNRTVTNARVKETGKMTQDNKLDKDRAENKKYIPSDYPIREEKGQDRSVAQAPNQVLGLQYDITETTLSSDNSLGGTQLLFGDEANKPLAYLLKKGETDIVNRIYLNDDEFILGRDKTVVNFLINDKSISKKHAIIKVYNNEYHLIDNESSNGTFLNNKRLQPYAECKLNDGDLITFANLQYKFHDK